MAGAEPLLAIEDLRLHIDTFDGTMQVLDGIDLAVARGDTLGIVGETGCGKSVTAKSILGLLPSPPARYPTGAIRFQGQDLLRASAREMRRIRGLQIAMIFQDPMTYLNPVFSVGRQMTDAILAHTRAGGDGRRTTKAQARDRAVEMLATVQLPNPDRQMEAYPHQLSGGMRQRVLIAMALSGRPQLLIADEPTTALDVTIQAQILNLIAGLVEDLGLAVIMISHDLGVVAKVCRRVAVMYAGNVVEEAPLDQLFTRPRHPYTQGLLGAIPQVHADVDGLTSIPGSIPNLIAPPPGCRFHPRCPHAMPVCRTDKPLLDAGPAGHRAACWLADRDAAA